MPRTSTHSDHAPKAIGPYSQAIWAGDLLYCSGQMPYRPGGRCPHRRRRGGRKTHRCFYNLQAVVESAGLTMDDAIKCNVYLVDMADFPHMNSYGTRFSQPFPARTTVAVAGLPLGARVEIELVARRS